MNPDQWIEKLKLFGKIFEARGWWQNFELTDPVSEERIKEIEKENDVKLPVHFKEVVKNIASSCIFEWSCESEEIPEEFKSVSTGGADFIWDVEQVINISDTIIEDYGFDPKYIFEFMYTGGGDIIAFDTTEGLDNAPVIYINHDGGTPGFIEDDKAYLHGFRLGYNFIDFMNRWISLGCPGNEYDGLLPFYDFDKNLIRSPDDPKLEKWLKWIHN